MKGSVTGKVVEWANGETMDQMVDQFGPWDYTGLGYFFLDLISKHTRRVLSDFRNQEKFLQSCS